MKKLLITLLVFSVSIGSVYPQNKTIKGRVISDQFDILSGVPIMINDTVQVGKTDLNGFFQINIPVSTREILFRDVGIELASIGLTDTCNEIEVVMILHSTYDFMSPRK